MLDDGTRKYVWGLGLAYAVDTAGNVEVSHTDGLGSVRAITSKPAVGPPSVVQTYTTDEFGIPTVTQGGNPQPFQYTGEQRDAETGLIYLRARMYEPGIGRFVQRDRFRGDLFEPLSLTRYPYAQANPINRIDPTGQKAALLLNGDADIVIACIPCRITELVSRAATWLRGALSRAPRPPPQGVAILSKPTASNTRLQRAINDLYQPTDTIPGGTAGAVRNEIFTGQPTGGRSHSTKAIENVQRLRNIIDEEQLSPDDLATAQALQRDLLDALNMPRP